MLLIPTFVALSKIHGYGVFTSVDVKEDTVVWEFNSSVDQMFLDDEFDAMLNVLSKENAKKIYSWSYHENGHWILCGDNAKFFNHSNNPSCKDTMGLLITTAKRNLIAGEELTSDYNNIDDNNRKLNEIITSYDWNG